jgi:hypothetical protein
MHVIDTDIDLVYNGQTYNDEFAAPVFRLSEFDRPNAMIVTVSLPQSESICKEGAIEDRSRVGRPSFLGVDAAALWEAPNDSTSDRYR